MFSFTRRQSKQTPLWIDQYINSKLMDYGKDLNGILLHILATNDMSRIEALKHKVNEIIGFVIYNNKYINTDNIQLLMLDLDMLEPFMKNISTSGSWQIKSMPNTIQMTKLYTELLNTILNKPVVSSGDMKLLIQQNQVTKAQLEQLQKGTGT